MDIQKLSDIAQDMRAFEARRFGLAPQAFSAIGQAPALPQAPKWFDVSRGGIAVSPDCSSQLVLTAIRKAKTKLDLYIYNITAPYLLAELAAAKAKGVTIRVMFDYKDGGAKEKAALQDLGITFRVAPSVAPVRRFSYCHQKFAVADDRYLLVQSANWADSAIPQRPAGTKYKMGNREWLIWVDSEDLSAWFTKLFELDWKLAKQGAAAASLEDETTSLATMAFAAAPSKEFDGGTITKKCKVYPLISPNNYQDLIPFIQGATDVICIQQQYIVAGKGVMELLAALAQKRQEGKTIRILVSPKFPEYWQRSIDTLKAAGLGDCLRASNLKFVVHCHNKGVLIDDRYTVVSSTNWSESSVTQAREAGLLVDSTQVAAYYREVFDFDWRVSIDPAEVKSSFAVVDRADEH